MSSLMVGQLARESTALKPADSVGKAAELLRYSVFGALPVVDGGRVLGLVTEEELQRLLPHLLSANGDGDATPIVVDIMRTDLKPLPDGTPMASAAQILEQQSVSALPVVDMFGGYRGMVSRSDVASALCDALSPPPNSIGGLATPFGVLLTTGSVRAGAGHLALVVTGFFLGLTALLSLLALQTAFWLIDRQLGTRWQEVFDRSQLLDGGEVLWGLGFTLLHGFFMLTLIRLSPLAGYHAAEHQVVHTIERAEPLTLEVVRSMPRPHPRCGTNLAVFLTLLMVLLAHVPRIYAIWVVVATLLSYRSVGRWVQEKFTTKPATDKQLMNGIQVGEELLRRFREKPDRQASFRQRLWNTGLPHLLVGLTLAGLLLSGVTMLQILAAGYQPIFR